MIEPTNKDIGKRVLYVPDHAEDNLDHKDCEEGFITSFNEDTVFVRYGLGLTSAATYRRNLYWKLY